MKNYKISEMLYANKYRWTVAEVDPSKSEDIDETKFDRLEGFEMLHMINSLFRTANSTLENFHQAEKLLFNHLPGTIQSHQKIRAWIAVNWQIV
jgi:hypothetical protein